VRLSCWGTGGLISYIRFEGSIISSLRCVHDLANDYFECISQLIDRHSLRLLKRTGASEHQTFSRTLMATYLRRI
jgi:hypothetical protein